MRNKKACVPDVNSFHTDPGDCYHTLFSPSVDPDGSIQLIPSGKVDIQEQIDSFRDQTDMSFIIKRLQMGDTSVLSDKEAMYGDFTNMPKTYAEFLQKQIDAQNAFMQLPLDIRNKFDNDFMKWFATSGSDGWFDKMKDYFYPDGVPVEEKVEEVKIDES